MFVFLLFLLDLRENLVRTQITLTYLNCIDFFFSLAQRTGDAVPTSAVVRQRFAGSIESGKLTVVSLFINFTLCSLQKGPLGVKRGYL